MQHMKRCVLRHLQLRCSPQLNMVVKSGHPVYGSMTRNVCVSSNDTSSEQLKDRVIQLVKKFDKIDASKVTETAHFSKDLSMDSLDKVELVMAFEQEFNVEIPDDKADKLACCADVVKYILTESQSNNAESS